jgi:hypothetical protein
MNSVRFRGGCAVILPILALATALATTRAHAQDQDSIVHSIAKQTGLATDVAPPADFVLKSRSDAPTDRVPVFRTPDEPPSKTMTRTQLKAMDADLEAAGKKQDVLRAGFAPSAKAVAEAEAAKKAKREKKRPEATPKPAF